MLLKLIYIEHKKTRKSFAFWLTIFGTMVIPAIFFLVMLIKPEKFTYPEMINPWKMLFTHTFIAVSSFLFPMYVIYLIGLLANIEYKSNNWKKLFVLPIRKELLISGKLLYVLLNVFLAVVLFALYVLLFGCLVGLIHPELKLLSALPDFTLVTQLIYHLFLALLGIVMFQFLLSMFFENILITLAAGLFLTVGSIIAAGFEWEYIHWIPYAGPLNFSSTVEALVGKNPAKDVVQGFGLKTYEMINLGYFALVFAVCLYFFKRKTVK